ncbi:MAG: PIN domain-containing protein [Chloroflexi bacterium]|nr:PIN domain-containing protein [Chloroflexota bacterium]
MPIIVDTGPLFALADRNDKHHKEVVRLVAKTSEVLIVPALVLPEVSYLINKYLSVEAEIKLLRSIASGEGGLRLEAVTKADLARAADVVATYADARVGVVDASIVAISERLNIRKVLTLDHRHFGAFRPSHCDVFEILP